jgi:hypothetical protein
MQISTQLGKIDNGGGAFTVNGNPADAADVLAALADLDAADREMIHSELDAVITVMKLRKLPLQYIPKGEGPAPTLDFKIPGNHGQSWSLGAKWNR